MQLYISFSDEDKLIESRDLLANIKNKIGSKRSEKAVYEALKYFLNYLNKSNEK
jgi:hypothetical protein